MPLWIIGRNALASDFRENTGNGELALSGRFHFQTREGMEAFVLSSVAVWSKVRRLA